MCSYFKLTDEVNYETIIRAEEKKQYRYIYGVSRLMQKLLDNMK